MWFLLHYGSKDLQELAAVRMAGLLLIFYFGERDPPKEKSGLAT